MVLFRVVEIEHAQAFLFQFPICIAKGNLHAIFQQRVLLAVGSEHGLGGADLGDLANGILVGRFGQAWVELFKRDAQVAGEDYFPV